MATNVAPSSSGSPSIVGKASSWVSNLGPTSAVVFSVVCVMLLVIIIAFIIWRVQRKNLKSVVLVKSPIRMYGSGLPYIIDKSKIPATVNGQEYSYSFWIYLVQYDPANSSIMVFGRGIQPTNIGGSPWVYMDKNTNKMYISIGLNNVLLSDKIDDVQASPRYVTATVDYIPLQRWVNISVVVQDYLMSVFMDGDMYTVRNVTDAPDIGSSSSSSSSATNRSIFGPTSGDVTVGAATAQPKAFLSQLQFFNFALTQREVKARYASGPTSSSALGVFGIPAYGIRSPMYKLDDDDATASQTATQTTSATS